MIRCNLTGVPIGYSGFYLSSCGAYKHPQLDTLTTEEASGYLRRLSGCNQPTVQEWYTLLLCGWVLLHNLGCIDRNCAAEAFVQPSPTIASVILQQQVDALLTLWDNRSVTATVNIPKVRTYHYTVFTALVDGILQDSDRMFTPLFELMPVLPHTLQVVVQSLRSVAGVVTQDLRKVGVPDAAIALLVSVYTANAVYCAVVDDDDLFYYKSKLDLLVSKVSQADFGSYANASDLYHWVSKSYVVKDLATTKLLKWVVSAVGGTRESAQSAQPQVQPQPQNLLENTPKIIGTFKRKEHVQG